MAGKKPKKPVWKKARGRLFLKADRVIPNRRRKRMRDRNRRLLEEERNSEE